MPPVCFDLQLIGHRRRIPSFHLRTEVSQGGPASGAENLADIGTFSISTQERRGSLAVYDKTGGAKEREQAEPLKLLNL